MCGVRVMAGARKQKGREGGGGGERWLLHSRHEKGKGGLRTEGREGCKELWHIGKLD